MCKGSHTMEVCFLPIKCSELFKANGEWGGGGVPHHSGTQVLISGVSAIFSI